MDEGSISLEKQALLFSQSLQSSLNAYKSLLELEEDQARLIEASDIEAVATKIDAKNSLLETLKNSDRELHEQHQLWQQVRDQAPEPLRQHLQNQVTALQEAMSQLLEKQQANESNLMQHSREIHLKLREIQKKKSLRGVYRPATPNPDASPSKFYDESH